MNLAKLTLCACPLILVSVALLNSSAAAYAATNLSQSTSAEFGAGYHVLAISLTPSSDRPSIPTGCSCARCTKAEELLQGQFPAF